MAHIIFLPVHHVGIHSWNALVAGLGLQYFIGERLLDIGLALFLLLGWRFQEHLPETFGFQVIFAFVGGCVSEEIGDRFFEFLDSDGEPVGFIGLRHSDEGITKEIGQSGE